MDGGAAEFAAMLVAMRPRLHRYCARMTGSAVDGEDAVQEAMLKALAGRAAAGRLDNPQGWLFRIAHHAALDLLRRRSRDAVMGSADTLASIAAPDSPDPDIAALGLRRFLLLPALPRSAVILKDVLGHSLEEVAAIAEVSAAAAKSALQRGRARLRALAEAPDEVALPLLSEPARGRLLAYVDGFRSGDFDAVRAMLAEDVRLDLVARLQRRGVSEVGEYYGRYAASAQWAYAAGTVDGHAAMLVYDRAVCAATPAYFVLLDFAEGRVSGIRDFLFARYAMEGAALLTIGPARPEGARKEGPAF